MVRNAALGSPAGGAPGSGLGGGLYLTPTCTGGAGCSSAFALLNNTLVSKNAAAQVHPLELCAAAPVPSTLSSTELCPHAQRP